MSERVILGIESSCDDCSAAIVKYESDALSQPKFDVLSLTTQSQIELHGPFGGIVPELASRNHLETINLVIDQAVANSKYDRNMIDAIAVTTRPGLIGSLLVGVATAKALAYAWKRPLLPIHHLEGHAMSVFLDQNAAMEFPALLAIISGGHTQLYHISTPPLEWPEWDEKWFQSRLIGESLDDAAGEAFDKTAKMLGFPYPGGVWLEQAAKQGGDPKRYSLPRPMSEKKGYDFSFSGLKTASQLLIQEIQNTHALKDEIPNLAASIQEAIVESLFSRIKRACESLSCKSLVIVGGVAANQRLREKLNTLSDIKIFYPLVRYCTDNAAMIAAAGAIRFEQGKWLSGKSLLMLSADSHA